MANAMCIYIYEGESRPVVFSTALTAHDRRQLEWWLAENPTLEHLVAHAEELADAEGL